MRGLSSRFSVKDTDAAELIRAVRVIAASEGLLSPAVTRRLIAEFAARAQLVVAAYESGLARPGWADAP